MTDPKSHLFVASFLYSRAHLPSPSERELLPQVLDQIQKDPLLKKSIHIINIDNSYSRNILQHNQAGVKIDTWPVFVLKYTQEDPPSVYPIDQVNTVFREVYAQNQKLNGTCSHHQAPQIKF